MLDPERRYVTGFSNGGRLVFLLMAERASEFAAFAPVGTVPAPARIQSLASPLPLMYIIGKGEIAGQLERTGEVLDAISLLNRSR